jgi:hypothetical protein
MHARAHPNTHDFKCFLETEREGSHAFGKYCTEPSVIDKEDYSMYE